MEFVYNKTKIGYSHLQKGTICQDYSDCYIDKRYRIITCCDGHGGALYVRSDRGSKFASQAVIDVINRYSVNRLESLIENKGLNKLKFEILCKWNELVEADYALNPFTKEELEKLDENKRFKLESNYISAYGTTLNAAIVTKKYLVCVQIGDGGMFFIKKRKMKITFEDNNENVANITNSLCGDDAYNNIFIKAVKKNKYTGLIMCTDGLLGPYQTYANFYQSFVKPFIGTLNFVSKDSIASLDTFIDKVADKIGIGDDVSFACLLYGE